jgi:5-carboxymethyl-2-hydroxymuconate isomerase
MPHLILEYSSNLEREVDIAALMKVLAETAVATGVFPLGGVRVRCHPSTEYRIADGHPDNMFLHLVLRIGHGRELDRRKRAGQAVFDALVDALAPVMARKPLALSQEIVEISPDTTWKKGNLRDHMRVRGLTVTD